MLVKEDAVSDDNTITNTAKNDAADHINSECDNINNNLDCK